MIELLVIGYGNSLRGDDAVGPRVAQALEELRLPGISALSCDLLAPELADPIAKAQKVAFVDASVEPMSSVRLRPLSPADSSQILAHAADPRTLLALARDVFGHAPPAWWVTIPVENLEIGGELSGRARAGIEQAIREIKKLQR